MTKEQKLELTRKIGLFGLNDLRKIAPIGDLGYANGWYYGDGSWMKGGMTRWNCDHHYYNKELGLRWAVDSGD